MGAELAAFSYSITAGVITMLLFYLTLTQKKPKNYYVFALAFLIACWSGLEYGLWLTGNNMFDMILYPAVPLDFFFALWIVFAGWVGERIGERKIFIYWLVALAAIFAIARVCMNCVKF